MTVLPAIRRRVAAYAQWIRRRELRSLSGREPRGFTIGERQRIGFRFAPAYVGGLVLGYIWRWDVTALLLVPVLLAHASCAVFLEWQAWKVRRRFSEKWQARYGRWQLPPEYWPRPDERHADPRDG